MFNSHHILGGFDTYAVSSNGRELVIHNVTASTAGDYGCVIELNSGTLVEGDTYSMQPLGMYVYSMIATLVSNFKFIVDNSAHVYMFCTHENGN